MRCCRSGTPIVPSAAASASRDSPTRDGWSGATYCSSGRLLEKAAAPSACGAASEVGHRNPEATFHGNNPLPLKGGGWQYSEPGGGPSSRTDPTWSPLATILPLSGRGLSAVYLHSCAMRSRACARPLSENVSVDCVPLAETALHHRALAGAHGVDHLRFFGRILDPGAVLLGVERIDVEPTAAEASEPGLNG